MDSHDETPILGHSTEEMQKKMDVLAELEEQRFSYESRTHKSEIEHSFYVECNLFLSVTFKDTEMILSDGWDAEPNAQALKRVAEVITNVLNKHTDMGVADEAEVVSSPRWWRYAELGEVERTPEEIAQWDAEQ